MLRILSYVFYPNPGNASYTSASMLALMAMSLLLIAGYAGIRAWRNKQVNAVTKKLSKSWAVASLWFGIVGVVLVVSRVEEIQFLGMRFMWALWAVALAAYVFVQSRLYRARHYEVLPTVRVEDPRDSYLPGKKRRR